MTKILQTLALSGLALVAVVGCENEITQTRTAETPMVVEQHDIPVTLYRDVQRTVVGGPCGFDNVNGRFVPRTCTVTDKVKMRDELLSVRVHFPAGSELEEGQIEKVKATFDNDGDEGFVWARVESRYHRYRPLNRVPVDYGALNDIFLELR